MNGFINPFYTPVYILCATYLNGGQVWTTGTAKWAGMPLKKLSSSWQHMLVQHPYVHFRINGTVTDAMSTKTPPEHHRCWLMSFVLATTWMGLFLFCLRDTKYIISTIYLKCGWARAQWRHSCFSHEWVSACVCRCGDELCLPMSSRAHVLTSFTESFTTTRIRGWFLRLSVMCKVFFRFSELFNDIMGCR